MEPVLVVDVPLGHDGGLHVLHQQLQHCLQFEVDQGEAQGFCQAAVVSIQTLQSYVAPAAERNGQPATIEPQQPFP